MKVMSREEKSSNDDLLSEPMERQDGFLGLQVVEGQMAGVSCGSLASPISMVSVSLCFLIQRSSNELSRRQITHFNLQILRNPYSGEVVALGSYCSKSERS